MSTQLDTDVRAALEQRRGEWQTIAKESGVSYSWISKFVNGHIPNPGFGTLKDLHAYLVAADSTAKAA
jgi:transcriptional regulator with XRE-family HTH domain